MRWAKAADGRLLATPDATGFCPICKTPVIPKCGRFVAWHWAHRAGDCDHWSEPESEWHRSWKAKFPARWQECQIGCHRADALTPIGIVEFQRSFLSADEIKEREDFYKDLIWVVDASSWTLRRQRRYCRPTTARQNHKEEEYEWIRPRRNWIGATCPVYLDFGASCHHLFLLREVDSTRRRTIAKTLRIRKKDFLRMCYGIPPRYSCLLSDHSSFDYYGEALKRRIEVLTAGRNRGLEILSDLPLFQGNDV